MNLNDYFDPVLTEKTSIFFIRPDKQLYSSVVQHTKKNQIADVAKFSLAILGVPNNDKDTVKAIDAIRNNLYGLTIPGDKIKICDLGNLKTGNSKKDSEAALRDVIVELFSNNTIPIILGLSENVLYPVYSAYKRLNKIINIISVDNKINISEDRNHNLKSALWQIVVEENDSLFSFSNIGYQSHFVGTNTLQFLSDSFNDTYRLGMVRENIKDIEPIFRDADFVSLNISSVRQSDAPGQLYPSPNGLYGEEICQISKYAGLGNKISGLGIFDYFFNNDTNNQTAQLIAQTIWYFLDGFQHRVVEYPNDEDKDFKKFIVNLDNSKSELIFYKSEKTQRWWIHIPSFKENREKNILISCTYQDYKMATQGEVPERWLKAYQKIN
ncbi:MAG: arginase family protein [Thiohalospira sp.]